MQGASNGCRKSLSPCMPSIMKHLASILTCLGCCFNCAVIYAEGENASPTNAPGSEEVEPLEKIVVEGVRASLRNAQEIKREESRITDSIVADDIQKLPDLSVTDALQRVTGVQVTRARGNGNRVTVRGLSQTETTLNGRELFSINDADGFGRSFNFTTLPSELVSNIDIYKTSSADLIEGGIGGTVDIRTYRPFDFEGSRIAGSVRRNYGDLVDRAGPQLSALLSNRWDNADWGRFGVLLDLSYQKRHYREDFKDTGNPFGRDDIVPGRTVFVNSGSSEYVNQGRHEWQGANLVLQWSPVPDLELYAEGSYLNFETAENTHQLNVVVNDSTAFVPGSPVLFAGSDDIRRITWTDAGISELSFIRDTQDLTKQWAVGGTWFGDRLTLKGDLSYTSSINDLVFFGPFLASSAATFSQDMGSSTPQTSVGGTDLLDPANYQLSGLAYVKRPFKGSMVAARIDGDYALSNGIFDSLSAGVRVAQRDATNRPGQASFFRAGSISVPDAVAQGLVTPFPYGDYLSGTDTTNIEDFLVGNLHGARNVSTYLDAFGVATPVSTSVDPLSLWRIEEKTTGLYLMTAFAPVEQPIDGNAGVRLVYTHESVTGHQSVPSSGETAPIDIDRSYVDVLPSINLRYRLANGLYLRGALSKTMTRQKFSTLSPSLTLFQNVANPQLSVGSAGNPDLDPIRSDNLDIALEKYFNPTTSVYVTGFAKRVDGFVTSVSNPEIHDGVTYQVTRPQNTGIAHIKGLEFGYQQFYDFLPGWMRGLGLQANYTYIDSEGTGIVAGEKLPLQDLSSHSYNLIGMYERGSLSVRIAYNWRDEFLSGIANIVDVGSVPIYTESYGWTDASVRYRLSDQLTLGFEAANLLGTLRNSNYNSERRPQRSVIEDTQYRLSLFFRF